MQRNHLFLNVHAGSALARKLQSNNGLPVEIMGELYILAGMTAHDTEGGTALHFELVLKGSL